MAVIWEIGALTCQGRSAKELKIYMPKTKGDANETKFSPNKKRKVVVSTAKKQMTKGMVKSVHDDDAISLMCLSAVALSQQQVVVVQPLDQETKVQEPQSSTSRKRTLKIPSLCLQEVRAGDEQAQVPVETSDEAAVEKLVILRAKSQSTDMHNNMKFPRRIPAQVIESDKKRVRSTNRKTEQIRQDVVCVADMFAETRRELATLCRVCAGGLGSLTAIFSELGNHMKLADKIHRFLPIRVSTEDRLPLVVCDMCIDKLDACEQLAMCSQEADLRLHLLLEAEEMQYEVEEMLIKKPQVVDAVQNETKKKMSSHSAKSSSSKKLTCPDCYKNFNDFRRYARHCYTMHKRKKCKQCDELFSSRDELIKHKLDVHGVRCECCGASFLSINSHLSHLRKHHPDYKSFTCEQCGKSFNSKYGLAIHSECHQTERPFLCDTCGKNFKSKRKLKLHKCVSSLNEALPSDNSCTICGRVYTLRSSLKRHLIRHKGERRFECNVCNKKFFGSVNLKNHMVIHDKSTLYECQMCCARYFHKRNMISHLKDKHSSPWNYKCPSCEQIFQSIDEVVSHRKLHDIEDIGLGISQVSDVTPGSCIDFQCKICNKYFENIYVLTYHFEDHVIRSEEDLQIKSAGDDGVFECSYCGEKMVSNWTMKRHMKRFHSQYIEPPELLYECEFCTKRFGTKHQLRQHLYQHTGERPYRCRFCDAGFRTQLAVKVHSRKHTGETPYHCLKCSKKFRSSATLRIHQGTHDKPFVCPHCGQRFPKNMAYKKHMALHASNASGDLGKRSGVTKCRHCDFVSKSRAAVKKHEQAHDIEPTYFNL